MRTTAAHSYRLEYLHQGVLLVTILGMAIPLATPFGADRQAIMETLTVLYDIRCELCRRVRAWLEAQPAYVRLVFIPAGSEEARRRFPQLDHAATLTELTAVGDGGDVYSGAAGWLICLWALRDYRAWALTLASPALMPTAQRFITWVSQNRSRLGQSEVQVCCADGAAGCSCSIDREVERSTSSVGD